MTALGERLKKDYPEAVSAGLDAEDARARRGRTPDDQARAAACCSAPWGSCCSSPARTSRTCCWPAPRHARASWPSAPPSAPRAPRSSCRCSPRASCSRWLAARSACCSPTAHCARSSRSTHRTSRGSRRSGSTRRCSCSPRSSRVCTGLVFGILPSLHASRADVQAGLREGGRSNVGDSGALVRRGLVVAEIALALVLLVSAGLLIRSFARLQQVDPGFDPRNLVTLNVALPPAQVPRRPRSRRRSGMRAAAAGVGAGRHRCAPRRPPCRSAATVPPAASRSRATSRQRVSRAPGATSASSTRSSTAPCGSG